MTASLHSLPTVDARIGETTGMEMGKITRGDRSEILKPGVARQAGKA
jgi:hypothetical protein